MNILLAKQDPESRWPLREPLTLVCPPGTPECSTPEAAWLAEHIREQRGLRRANSPWGGRRVSPSPVASHRDHRQRVLAGRVAHHF